MNQTSTQTRPDIHTPDESYEAYCKRVEAQGVQPARREVWETVIRDGKFTAW